MTDRSANPQATLAHTRVVAVITALRDAGAQHAADNIVVFTSSAPTAAAAAEKLGCPLGAIANSLVFNAQGQPLLVMTSGAHRVDTHQVADLLGVPALDRADADFVREHTGQAIGGVAPVGHPHPIGTVVDTDLLAYDTIWAAAGHPHTMFPTTFDELLRLTDGTPAEVGP